jgi:hypothetical protein
MAAEPERSDTIGVDELRSLEISVLKTLCLTINTAGSELKYKILDSLSEDDFYFPILRAVFRTLAEMHLRGDYVISANLGEELQKTDASVPAGFSIEQLFDGNLPSLTDLNVWVTRLKERSRSGLVPTVAPPIPEPVPHPPKADATVVKSVAEVKKRIAEEHRKSNPTVVPGRLREAPPSSPSISSPNVRSAPRPQLEKSSPAIPPIPRVKPVPTPPPSERPPSPPPPAAMKRAAKAVLSSEGEEWSSYLEDLAANQGKRFDTGFARLDEGLGGLSPGIMLVIDEDRERVVSFLKQLADQVASAGAIRCLFVAAEIPKSALRLRTISRLAAVKVADLEKGRLKKDSPEWSRVDAAGRSASEWLRRVFVYEVEGELEISLVQDLARKLQEASEEPVLVVVDALERVARAGSPQSVVSQLKSLADSLDVLILAAATDPTLLASRDADYAAVFRTTPHGLVELEVLRSGKESSTLVRFRYEPEVCRFKEVDS